METVYKLLLFTGVRVLLVALQAKDTHNHIPAALHSSTVVVNTDRYALEMNA